MNILDRPEKFSQFDKDNLLKSIEEFYYQCEKAWTEIKKLILPSYYLAVKKIIIAGMGGSGIGGEVAKSLAEKQSTVPVITLKNYELPSFASKDTLLIAVSYSGDTEEILSVVKQAEQKGVRLIAITTGGELEKLAKIKKFPIYKFDYKTQPRQAFGFLFTAVLGILNKLAIVDVKEEEFKDLIILLRGFNSKLGKNVETEKNQAKQLALKLYQKIPIIFGAALSEIAFRFKTQINENAKQIAFSQELPEACHNTINGFDFPKLLPTELFCLFLSSKFDHPRNKTRIKIYQEILNQAKIPYEELIIEPASTLLIEKLSFVILLDYASYYLAILNKVDPTEIQNIKYLKRRLNEM